MNVIRNTFLTALLSIHCALADQAAYISKTQTEAALHLLKNSTQLRFFCKPCGETTSELVTINSIINQPTGYENFWEIQVNRQGIDLAYTYYYVAGRWRNLAIALNIPVQDVPNYLNAKQLNTLKAMN